MNTIKRMGEYRRSQVPDWDDTVGALSAADEVVVAGHVNPDGDAIGSILAATLGLRKIGKKAWPTWGDEPAEVPFNYRFLPGASEFVQPRDVPAASVFLALDCGVLDRLGVLEGAAQRASLLINVDHHAGNTGFGDLNVVVTTASSTSELLTFLLVDAGIELDSQIATCLYTGIVTDTGRFQYGNSSPDVMRLAADLLTYGVPAVQVAQEVFESSPFGYLKLVGRVLDRAVLHENAGFVYSWLTLDDLEATGVGVDETEKLIDQVRSTRSARVAAMFKEQGDGSYRVSLRSKGPVSVGAIARANGGGGHELAAGFTAPSVDAGAAIVLDALDGAGD
jgi:bifunctional oligoribonuclease and PAP phosphatase NrnA